MPFPHEPVPPRQRRLSLTSPRESERTSFGPSSPASVEHSTEFPAYPPPHSSPLHMQTADPRYPHPVFYRGQLHQPLLQPPRLPQANVCPEDSRQLQSSKTQAQAGGSQQGAHATSELFSDWFKIPSEVLEWVSEVVTPRGGAGGDVDKRQAVARGREAVREDAR